MKVIVDLGKVPRTTRDQIDIHDVSYYISIADLLDCPEPPDCEKCKAGLKSSFMNQMHIGLTLSNSCTPEGIELVMEITSKSLDRIIDNMPLRAEVKDASRKV